VSKKQSIEKLLLDALTEAKSELAQIEELLPHVQEHRLRSPGPKTDSTGPQRRRNVSYECTEDFQGRKMESTEPDPEPLDLKAMMFLVEALKQFFKARQALAARLPAKDAQLKNRSLVASCVVCEDLVSKLVRGLCDPCYRAWRRGGQEDIETWIPTRREVIGFQKAK
jgi:hypothetical protein